jgi:DNA-binding response OmpR family regulator
LVIDRAACRATLAGCDLALTPTEYRLLSALAARPDEVHGRKDLAQQVWNTYDSGIDRTLDVHMRRLRAKLQRAAAAATSGGAAPALETVRGFGYRLVSPPPGAAHAARRAA